MINLMTGGGERIILFLNIREAAKKKLFFGISFPNLFTQPPTPGFLWDLGEQKVKFGSKKSIFGVIFFRGLDLVWESATLPPTFGRNLPKNGFYFGGLPLWIYVTLFVMSHWSIPIRHFSKCSQVGLEVAGLFSLSHFLPTSPSRCCPLVLWLPPNPFKRTDEAAVQGRPTTLVKKET